MERGNISIHTENIFPIIKKWLYSDKDIFVRELISNGCDAVHKLKRLVSLGEAKIEEDNDYKIVVKVNKDKKMVARANKIFIGVKICSTSQGQIIYVENKVCPSFQ